MIYTKMATATIPNITLGANENDNYVLHDDLLGFIYDDICSTTSTDKVENSASEFASYFPNGMDRDLYINNNITNSLRAAAVYYSDTRLRNTPIQLRYKSWRAAFFCLRILKAFIVINNPTGSLTTDFGSFSVNDENLMVTYLLNAMQTCGDQTDFTGLVNIYTINNNNITMVCVSNEIINLTSNPNLVFSDVTKTFFTVLPSTSIDYTIDCSNTDKSTKSGIETALTTTINAIVNSLNTRITSIGTSYTELALSYGFNATVTPGTNIDNAVKNFITIAKQNNIGTLIAFNSNKSIILKFSLSIPRYFDIPAQTYTCIIKVNF